MNVIRGTDRRFYKDNHQSGRRAVPGDNSHEPRSFWATFRRWMSASFRQMPINIASERRFASIRFCERSWPTCNEERVSKCWREAALGYGACDTSQDKHCYYGRGYISDRLSSRWSGTLKVLPLVYLSQRDRSSALFVKNWSTHSWLPSHSEL